MTELRFTVTQEDIRNYAELSGDQNPVHLDKEYAKDHGFSGPITHGMLTMAKIWSVISGRLLTSADFPEEYDLAFLSPVYAGDLVILQIESQPFGFKLEGLCGSRKVIKGTISIKAAKDDILKE